MVMAGVLRGLISVFFIAGAGLVVSGLLLQMPPTAFVPIMMLALGGLQLLSGVLGFLSGSGQSSMCGRLFVGTGSVAAGGLGILALAIFFKKDAVVEAVTKVDSDVNEQADDLLTYGRWAYIVAAAVEVVSVLLVAMGQCCCTAAEADPEHARSKFSSMADRAGLYKLHRDVEGGTPRKGGTPKKGGGGGSTLHSKMQEKYGSVAHDAEYAAGSRPKSFREKWHIRAG